MKTVLELLLMNKAKAIPWYLSSGIPAANCIAAYKAIGAVDIATSYINLANPGTYNLTAPTAAPTFNTVTGWAFNGSSQYLATGITIPDARTWTMIIRFDNVAGNTGYMCGYFNNTGAKGFIMTPFRSGTTKYYNGTAAHTGISGVASGILALAGDQCYFNGATDGAIAGGDYAATTASDFYIGANHYDINTPPVHTYFAGRIQAVAIYDAILTPTQVGAVTAAMLPLV
jgi:hypothetical protein